MTLDRFVANRNKAAESERLKAVFENINAKAWLELARLKFELVPYCPREELVTAAVRFNGYEALLMRSPSLAGRMDAAQKS